jgi:hypothetical protein
VSISLSEQNQTTLDGVVLRSASRDYTISARLVRKLVPHGLSYDLGMSNEGGTANSNQQKYSTYFEDPVPGTNCPGSLNEFYCPPCKTPLPCSRDEDVFSGDLPDGSIIIFCDQYPDPNVFGNTISGYTLMLGVPAGVLTRTALGANSFYCGTGVEYLTGDGIYQAILASLTGGCFDLNTFNVTNWGEYGGYREWSCYDSGYSTPWTQCGSTAYCDWQSNPNQNGVFPWEDFSAFTCPLNGCLAPSACYIFDCSLQISFYSECGCDGIMDAGGFQYTSYGGTGAIGILRVSISRSVNITFTP